MASLKDLEGKWRLFESHGFEKELGVGLALRKMAAMAKPDCIITCDGNNLNRRKTETVCTFTDGAQVQHQKWEGKESKITRKLKDGKMAVECVMNNATCTRVYEKVQ